jgi:hypothetical protein
MQQFTVPQFIDVEDKIIGPITTRQFLIILADFMLIAVCYKFFDFALFLVSGIFLFVIAGILAFVKINGMPFHYFVLNFIETISRPNLRVWNNAIGRIETFFETEGLEAAPAPVPEPGGVYTMSRLAELSLIVDTSGSYRGEERGGMAEIKISSPVAPAAKKAETGDNAGAE